MSIGIWQLILIFLIILLLFGSGKLPKVMNDIASGIKNMKKTLKEEHEEEKGKKENDEKK
jgi:sec-independent protein translocase protein TatA